MAHDAHHHGCAYGDFSSCSSSHGFEMNHGLGLFHHQDPEMEMEMLEMQSKHFFPKAECISPDANFLQRQQQSRLLVDDQSLRCLFPSQGYNDVDQLNVQGLSLSLPHPETAESIGYRHQQQQVSVVAYGGSYQSYQLKNSMYLIPAQELLNEFCNPGGGSSPRSRLQKLKAKKDAEPSSSSPSLSQPALLSMDILELQKLKSKLLSMLEEVRLLAN